MRETGDERGMERSGDRCESKRMVCYCSLLSSFKRNVSAVSICTVRRHVVPQLSPRHYQFRAESAEPYFYGRPLFVDAGGHEIDPTARGVECPTSYF